MLPKRFRLPFALGYSVEKGMAMAYIWRNHSDSHAINCLESLKRSSAVIRRNTIARGAPSDQQGKHDYQRQSDDHV